jgi:hypothetical protein
MTENIIHQITLECLINREKYEKQTAKEKTMKINKKDKKFYRRRVLNLTRELLLSKKEGDSTSDITNVMETVVTPDLLNAFNNYIKACIHNFKIIDKNDIIQEDYKDMNMSLLNDLNFLDLPETLENENQNIDNNTNENNKLIMRTIKEKSNLDNFVKIKYKKPQEDIIIPKIREINLNDPNLRNKGIKKKEKENNINIVYDENKKK